MNGQKIVLDGNEAAAWVAHRLSDVIAIYPITPSSPMGESADAWSSEGVRNLWGTVPQVMEMQSEGGAAGVLHGAMQAGGLTTTFTASQGLLLMLPNMFKIAGELTPTVLHVSARTVAAHALSIFGDHGDVMAARTTGFAMLASGSVQEVMDNALIAHAAALESRVPFLHFFDGFRTSHEVSKISALADEDLRAMIDERWILAHRGRALSPDAPVLRGTAQNPDVFFQAREACNPYYRDCPEIVQRAMSRLAERTGRPMRLFDYVGAPDAERVIVLMGSGAETVHETVDDLVARGEKVGVVKVRLFRPFAADRFVAALPATTRRIAVLDRTKEPGSAGEPLYQDVLTALVENADRRCEAMNSSVAMSAEGFREAPRVIGGRYGLSSKEFTPAMVKAVFDELSSARPKNHFTVGIQDDVTHASLAYNPSFSTEDPEGVRAVFFGLGADGTVGANKNSIKIIGENTAGAAQGYFVYDSKKAGSVTISHLRFGPRPIRSAYLIQEAEFVACHHASFLERFDVLGKAAVGATLLLNTAAPPGDAWDSLPLEAQAAIIAKRLRLFVIDAREVARNAGLGGRINTVMQVCFFALSNVLPRDEAIQRIKEAIEATYGEKGPAVVQKNFAAVDQSLANLTEVKVPDTVTSSWQRPETVSPRSPAFVREVTAPIMAGDGDGLPVSAFPADGTFPTGTAAWEKRCIAAEIPLWDPDVCIQCGKCVLVCPHAAIRMKAYDPACLAGAPESFLSTDARGQEFAGLRYTLQTAPEDCTGCGLCVDVCPAKNKSHTKLKAINMSPLTPVRQRERDNYAFFLDLPEYDRSKLKIDQVKGSQFLLPLFEYSGACAGCGETPYVKLVSQLFGDRAVIANATGCSSIYGGNLPTTPWSKNREGRGPAWSNSLFEDNAEFGLGMRLAIDKQTAFARELLQRPTIGVSMDLVAAILSAEQAGEAGIREQRDRVRQLKAQLEGRTDLDALNLLSVADALVKRSVWIIGGDGWAYDIGFGGLDHVLASGQDVNVLVLDTEVYSNTGGQCSKSTPLGAVAKFAAAGKTTPKKDLGLLAMSYGHIYVARVAMGANDQQTVKTFVEAESYPGPSLVIAYSHCIAHGIDMGRGMRNQKAAVDSGYWPLFRFDPRLRDQGKHPLQLDSGPAKIPLADYTAMENRFSVLTRSDPGRAAALMKRAQADLKAQRARYEEMAGVKRNGE